jgi:hypothetical protein
VFSDRAAGAGGEIRLCGAPDWRKSRAKADDEDEIMDYKAAGAPKIGRNAPRHSEHNAPGSDKKPFGQRPGKAELLARMKAAAGKQTAGNAGDDAGDGSGDGSGDQG